ncbi:MAG: hypothetical protein WC905_02320 [Patescibacteria group bacterium]|jgi:hypothetical protein
MFVKIIRWKKEIDVEKAVKNGTEGSVIVKRDRRISEIIIECSSFSVEEKREQDPAVVELVLDGHPYEYYINEPEKATDIFIMNPKGVTIDRYVY